MMSYVTDATMEGRIYFLAKSLRSLVASAAVDTAQEAGQEASQKAVLFLQYTEDRRPALSASHCFSASRQPLGRRRRRRIYIYIHVIKNIKYNMT